ncbi:hypothetical protein PM025_06955 [Halorubrum ezzemoulense]|uniref:hypothetical protein n=1 Tax=Halorubrum ezzemoulense TaxID=337243 RepID=UPI00232ACAC1|nr:hypothetical protein [Halorubrum ezzemoulense]MDB2263887.1 hypothetical protein [Halorubrum ezzemoulense]MDB2269650.1 hypothetical protein [Halorubrum ezzemoulense]MDB9299550.1 hypothetical protein [Halorubrum ezzemoulense]
MNVATSPSTRVRPLRALSIALAFAAATGLIFGTAGFTAMEADRGLAVNVTDDERAYLGYAPLADEVRDGELTAVVEYRNRFGSGLDDIDVDVSIAPSGSPRATIESVDPPSSLDEGAAAAVDVTLRCPVRERVPLVFEVDGNGGGVSVSLSRVHTVTCVPTSPMVTGVRYAGVGNAFVEAGGERATVEATVWLTDSVPGANGSEGSLRSETVASLNPSSPVRPQLSTNASNERIVGVAFPEQGVAYFHPGWNGANHVAPREGPGVRRTGVPLDAETVRNTSVVEDD